MLILVAILAAFFAYILVGRTFSTIVEFFMFARFNGVSYFRRNISRVALFYAFLRKTDRGELNSVNPKTVECIFHRFEVFNSRYLFKNKYFETDASTSVSLIGMIMACSLSVLEGVFCIYALSKLAHSCGLSVNIIGCVLSIAVILDMAGIALFAFLFRPIKVEDIVSRCQERYGECYQELVDFSQSDLFKRLVHKLEQEGSLMYSPWRYAESYLYRISKEELAEINAFGKHHE